MNLGRNELLIAGVVLVVTLLIATPWLLTSGHAGRLDDIRERVEALRAAELDHQEAFGTYVGAEAAPRPPHALGAEPVPWVPSAGFARLAWAPVADGPVYASYAVTLTPLGFRAVGRSDLDGDGEHAVIEATHESPATATSPPGVY